MDPSLAYKELIERSHELGVLGSCARLLSWDEETNMPSGAVEARSRQLAYLAGMFHDRQADPRIAELLSIVAASDLAADVESPAAVNVREIRRDYEHAVRVPRSLVEELARTTSCAHQEWVTSRKANDFGHFRPWLERIVELKRAEAECLGYSATPYDALLDTYEPGATTAAVSDLLGALQSDLLPLLERILGAADAPDASILHRDYPVDKQRALGEAVASRIGFDFSRGRLDVSAHPFCSGIAPGDCRITTRYRVDDLSEALFAIVHEVGHGLYEQGLDPSAAGTPMGEAASLGVHESQSRLWENIVGRSRAFWAYFFRPAQEQFPAALGRVSLDDFHGAVNHVKPSVNRVRADEVTYNLHIVVRFELERALIAGDLAARDLPGAWNEAYGRTLGITPATDADGCLQDGHWSSGLIGYFPTYAIGDVCASQLFTQAERELGEQGDAFARGDFAPLLGWLRETVHRHGRRDTAAPLVRRVTGGPLDPGALVGRLQSKYEEIYRLTPVAASR